VSNGYLFAPGDVEGLACGIRCILEDKRLARSMSCISQDIARQHDVELSLQAYEKFYEAQVAQKQAGLDNMNYRTLTWT
jgi:glycosyltransferase involved in cell wall biosynthesis